MLWNASNKIDVLIISDQMPTKEQAVKYTKEQLSYYGNNMWEEIVSVSEIKSMDDVPNPWQGNAICFGDNPTDLNARNYFKFQIVEQERDRQEFLEARKTYLRLRNKFENI